MRKPLKPVCWGSTALRLARLLHCQCPWSSGHCGFLNPNPRRNPNPDQSRNLRHSIGLSRVPMRKPLKPVCWGSTALRLARLLHCQCPWSSGHCGFLNPNPRRNPNPDQSRNLRHSIGLSRVPMRKPLKPVCWGSTALRLARLLHCQCPWSSGHCGFQDPHPRRYINPDQSRNLRKSIGLSWVPKRKSLRRVCWGSIALPLAFLSHCQWTWNSGLCGFLNTNPRCNPNPSPRRSLRQSIGLSKVPMRRPLRMQFWGSTALPLAYFSHCQCPWNSGHCGFLNPNPRRNPNPSPRRSIRHSIGLSWVPMRRPLRMQFWGSTVALLARLSHCRCPWSSGLCGFLNPNPRRNPNPSPRCSLRHSIGLSWVPKTKSLRLVCWGSTARPLTLL
ncbi:PREDICTED: uncharacterized protein LOC108444615 [Corvus brachyrhynchos]|uniref:uncharacterized protein LOC108444615 n=1 Tax=Corvus brachyrhynchos TaxID=85066 RepID=UPI00081663B4|nr:PREDICTED: uncharacterized protein LOC108444615 [Corvus brachyrhynchos]